MKTYLELSKAEEERAQELIEKALFVNTSEATHQDEFNQSFYDQMVKSGLDSVHLTMSPAGDIGTLMRTYCDWKSVVHNLGEDKLTIVKTSKELLKAKEDGKKSLILGLQGSPIGTDLRLIEILKLCGITVFQLTYNFRNQIADGADGRTDGLLSKFGVQVVEELNRTGILVDLSHVGIASTMDAMEISKDPVTFSHVGARALCDHFRCITDEQIKALAENKGMIGVVALNGFLVPDGWNKLVTIEDYLNHIDHIANLVGVDYVGIGTDIRDQETTSSFTHQKQTGRLSRGVVRSEHRRGPSQMAMLLSAEKRYPKGMVTVGEYGNITRGLVARGYSDQDIEKILGLNFMRVFKRICG